CRPPSCTLFPYTTLFRSLAAGSGASKADCPLSATPAARFAKPTSAPVPAPEPKFSARMLLASRAVTTMVKPEPATMFGTALRLRSEEHTSELQSRGHLVC